METSTFYNLQLENDIKDAISLIEVDPSKKNKKILTDLLKNKFDKNKGTFFEMFSNDRLTFEQQKILFDSIEVRQKCNIYNAISVESRERYLAYLVYTENNWSIEQIKEIYRFGKRGGLSSVAGTPHEFDYFGNPEYHITLTKTGEIKVSINAMEGHHMLNVHDYPEFAGDGKNIQFLGKLAAHAKEVFIPRTHYV